METAAQSTVALMPTCRSRTSSARGESVRRMLGWKQPKGFERRLLWMRTPSPRTNREPRETLTTGRPQNLTPCPSEQPLKRASSAQRPESDSRPQFSRVPSVCDQLRDGMDTDYLKACGWGSDFCLTCVIWVRFGMQHAREKAGKWIRLLPQGRFRYSQ